jgi:ATP-dependent Clp protease adapter protein ClpS
VEGAAAPYRRAPAPQLFAVVLWNDSKSTMEGVLRVLTETFELDAVEALHVMVTVHYMGQATVRRYPEGEARLVAERALALAGTLGMPLRITTTADTLS